MYSSGIPILYPIAFIFFFFTYWFDKMFCKFSYKSDWNYSAQMAQETTFLHAASIEQNKNDNEILPNSSLFPRSLHVHELLDSYAVENLEPNL